MVGFSLAGVSERDERHFGKRSIDLPRLFLLDEDLIA
jgi:hypothetical protein